MRIYLTVTAATFAASLGCEADGLIVDLGREDGSVLAQRLAGPAQGAGLPLQWRIDSLEEADFADALAGAAAPRPAAILVPATHGRDLARAGAMLAVHEAEQGWPDGATGIVALVTRAAGALALATFAGASPRLVGIGWDAGSLAAELGLIHPEPAGELNPLLAQVRALVRLAAAAARVEAIETACPPGADLRQHAANALRDGSGAILAQAPEDVPVIRSVRLKPV